MVLPSRREKGYSSPTLSLSLTRPDTYGALEQMKKCGNSNVIFRGPCLTEYLPNKFTYCRQGGAAL
jgi:hypothetical protein